MQLEILVDRVLALRGGAVHRLEGAGDGAELRLRRPLGGEAGDSISTPRRSSMTCSMSPIERIPSWSMRNGAAAARRETNAPTPWRVDDQSVGAQGGHRLAHHVRLTRAARESSSSVGSRAPAARRPLLICSESCSDSPRDSLRSGTAAES